MFYLGGMTIVGAGWLGYQGVYLDFVSQYTADWLWQLYANRTLIGRTASPTERRIIGQLLDDNAPSPLTLVRVDPANVMTDYGSQLPRLPWNHFTLEWNAASFPADTDHFDITASTIAGGPVDASNVIARVPFVGNGPYTFPLPAVPTSGVWSYAITSRDDAHPFGNASTPVTASVTVAVPPTDISVDQNGNRFDLTAVAGVLTASFTY